MVQSAEKSAIQILSRMQELASLPVISGGSFPPSLEWSMQHIYEVVSNWNPGSVSDPLELNNYLAIGDTPATAGAIRLASGAGIQWRNAANNGNVNWFRHLSFEYAADPGVNYDVLKLVGQDPDGSEYGVFADENWIAGLAVLQFDFLVGSGALTQAYSASNGNDPFRRRRLFIDGNRDVWLVGADAAAGFAGDDPPYFHIKAFYDGNQPADYVQRVDIDDSATGKHHYSLTINTTEAFRVDQALRLGVAKDIEMSEMSEPPAPSANNGRLFMKDTGGKTQLLVRFPSGASQVIATEP